jgi:methyl-accepting chemotaxis protein
MKIKFKLSIMMIAVVVAVAGGIAVIELQQASGISLNLSKRSTIFASQPDFVRMFNVWKPNVIDGMDSRFIGRTGSTNTGQFAFALGRETGQVVAGSSQVVPAIMEHITGSNAQKDSVAHPDIMKLAGKDVYVVRLFVPIINMRTNEVVGAVGGQLNIDLIQPVVENSLRTFEEVAALSMYSSNGFILASYRPDRIGNLSVTVLPLRLELMCKLPWLLLS